MKRLIMALALGAGLLAGCSESETYLTAAGISGAYDLTLVDRLVFVTSSNTDELRVLDLDASPRDYVRAPNPLEPLSIPVLDRPLALQRDMSYDAAGQEVVGPYLYVRSAGSQELSVVGAARDVLRELKPGGKRLIAPGIVTALAGRGPATAGGPSQLYYATQSADGARVWRQELSAPETLESAIPAAPVLVARLQPGETVQALLVLPAPNQLVIATRSNAGRGGRTFRLDTTVPEQFVELRFGAPVRQLFTHPTVTLVSAERRGEALVLQAGTRVYGILDEAACGGQPACSGVLAVDASSGEVSRELIALTRQEGEEQVVADYAEGPRMVPITVGDALPTGLSLAPSAQLLVVEQGQRVIDLFPLLGIVPASDGRITLFNAAELRQFDFEPLSAEASAVELRDAAEQVKAHENGRPRLTVGVVDGATTSDTYRVFYQAALAGLGGLARTSEGGTFEVSRTEAERSSVQPGDIIVLEGDSGVCSTDTGAPVDLVVATVAPGSERSTTLTTTTPIPEACPLSSHPRFSVLAGGAKPFVVASASQGFIGRMGAGETFNVAGPYFRHPDEYTSPSSPPPPARAILSLSDLDPGLTRGDRYVFATDARYVPYIVEVNRVDTSFGLANYRLPSSVAFTKAADGTDFAYLAYPSADGILQMNLELLYFDQLNDTGLKTFQ